MSARSDEIKRSITGYRGAAETMRQMREEKLRNIDVAAEIEALSSAYEAARLSNWKKPPTGLTKMRRLLDKMGR